MLIVEGELDKLAVEEATGITAVLSVPAGAAAVSAAQKQHQQHASTPIGSSSSQKFPFVRHAMPLLAHCSRIIIAVDGDTAGWHTAVVLARQLGMQRCSYLAWPSAAVGGAAALERVATAAHRAGLHANAEAGLACKDANDVLMCYSKAVLKLYVQIAPVPFPQV